MAAGHGGAGDIRGMGGFCWGAREVYGPDNPRWLEFRAWILSKAPAWLHDASATHGKVFADWLRDKPVAKAAIRRLMDVVVSRYHAVAANR